MTNMNVLDVVFVLSPPTAESLLFAALLFAALFWGAVAITLASFSARASRWLTGADFEQVEDDELDGDNR